MRPHAIFFVLMILSVVSAFTPSHYFYADETDVTVSYKNFSLNGDDYSIVYFDGDETFLLKDGEIVNDSEEISDVVYSYYIKEYYPSDEELNQTYAYIKQYNKSRNDGYGSYKNQEEYICRMSIFTDKRIDVYIDGEKQKLWCHDDASCEMNAMFLYQYGHDYFGWGSPDVVLEPIREFSYASWGTEAILNNYTYKLDNLESDTLVDTITYIKENIPTLIEYAEDMENTIFRTPRYDDEADRDDCYLRCYAMCPAFEFDTDVLDDLESHMNDIYDKVQPLVNYEDNTAGFAQETKDRLEYRYVSLTGAEYEKIFDEEEGVELEEYGRDAYGLVANTSLMMKIEDMVDLRESIRTKIDTGEFTGIEEEISLYNAKLDAVKEGADSAYVLYNETTDAKNLVTSLLFEIGTKEMSPANEETYNRIKDDVDEADLEFTDGLTPDKMTELRNKYKSASNDAARLLQAVSTSASGTAVSTFRSFATKMNEGIASLVQATAIADEKSIPENKYLALGGFSALTFISFIAIAFLLFLWGMSGHRRSQLKYVIAAAFVVLIIFIGLFAGFLFFYMDKAASEATMEEFLLDFQDRDNIALVGKIDLATSEEESAIKSCINSLSQVMEDKNKSVDIYYFEPGDMCEKNGGRFDGNCNENINEHESVIILHPSLTTEAPVLSATYISKAEISATKEYYKSCPLTFIFE